MRSTLRTPGDRRRRARFEVVGPFWGTLNIAAPMRIRDLTTTGALLETDQPIVVESLRSVALEFNGERATCAAQVRHIRALDGRRDRYLVGIEFVSMSQAFREAVDRLATFGAFPTELL
jgi:hypothetical protein